MVRIKSSGFFEKERKLLILTRRYNLDVVPGGLPLLIRVSRKDTSSTLVFSLFAGNGALDVPVGTTATVRGKANVPAIFSVVNQWPVDVTRNDG